jgi:hypothetical protein
LRVQFQSEFHSEFKFKFFFITSAFSKNRRSGFKSDEFCEIDQKKNNTDGISTFIFVYESSIIQLHKNGFHLTRGVVGTEINRFLILDPKTPIVPPNYGHL